MERYKIGDNPKIYNVFIDRNKNINDFWTKSGNAGNYSCSKVLIGGNIC